MEKSSMADLDVQVQLSCGTASRPAKGHGCRAMPPRARQGGRHGRCGRQAAKAGDAGGIGRAARDAGEATRCRLPAATARAASSSRPIGATPSLENMARSSQRAGQSHPRPMPRPGACPHAGRRLVPHAGRHPTGRPSGAGAGHRHQQGRGCRGGHHGGRGRGPTPLLDRERQYLQDATVAFNERTEAGIKAGVAELRALDQQIVARGGGTLDSARAMRGAFLAGGCPLRIPRPLAPDPSGPPPPPGPRARTSPTPCCPGQNPARSSPRLTRKRSSA